MENATDSVRQLPAFMVSILGAADVNGRMVATVGGWDVRFAAGGNQSVIGGLYFNGNLSYQLQPVMVPMPPTFVLESAWIDSTAVAELMIREPFPAGMPEKCSIFLQMRMVEGVGLVSAIRRSSREPGSGISYVHSLGVNATNGEVAGETVELRRLGAVIESRARSRLDGYGEWVDQKEQQ